MEKLSFSLREWVLLFSFTYITYCKQPWEDLPSNTRDYCPSRNICNWTAQQPVKILGPLATCCQDCSCQSTCGNEGDCCFQDLDITNGSNRKYKSCLQTTIPELASDDTHKFIHYLMIDTNPDDGCKVNVPELPEGEQCGNVSSGWLGPLYPYYSKSKKIIFKNKYCAQCHNASEVIESTVALHKCRLENLYEAINSMKDIKEVIENLGCRVTFSFKGFEVELKKEQCFLNIVDECEHNFTVPDDFQLERNEIERACTSGLFSPFIGNALYSNVFCAQCNDRYAYSTTVCSVPSNDFSGKAGGSRFSILLDVDLISTIHSEVSTQKGQLHLQQACLSNYNQNECRQLFCPAGRTLINGECSFLSNKLLDYSYTVTLKLIPDMENKIQISHVEDKIRLNNGIISQYSSWSNKWTVYKMYAKVNNYRSNETLSEELFVKLFRRFKIVDPSQQVNQIQLNLQKTQFVLSVGNSSFVFKQSLAQFSRWHLIRAQGTFSKNFSVVGIHEITNIAVRERLLNDYVYIQVPIANTLLIPTYIGFIKKTHFCDMIQLHKDEYILYAEGLIHYTVLDVFLFDGEFTTTIDDHGDTIVKICWSDSPFRLSRNSSAKCGVSVYFTVFVCIVRHWINDMGK